MVTHMVTPPVPQELLDAVRHVIVMGDIHGVGQPVRRALDLGKRGGLSLIVQVGDFGVGPFSGEMKSFTKLVDRMLSRADAWMLVTPGNHENYARLNDAPRDAAGMIVLGERLRALPRGFRWLLGGLRFGSLGGATSVDRASRTEGRSWWPQERITQADVDALGDEPLDVLITHEVPAGVPVVGMNVSRVDPATLAEADEGRRLVRRAVERTRPRVVPSGHWHQRLTHDLALSPGGSSRCEVLPDETDRRNAMAMDVADLDAPLVELGDWVRAREGRDPEE